MRLLGGVAKSSGNPLRSLERGVKAGPLICALAITTLAAIPRWVGLDVGGGFAAAHPATAVAAAPFAAALVIAAIVYPWPRRAMLPIALGLACGLAFSTKYTIGLAPAAVLAVWRPPGREPAGAVRRLLAFGFITAATVLALNGFWRSHPGACWRTWTDVIQSQYQDVELPCLRDVV